MEIILIYNNPAGRKIRSRNIFHHLFGIDIRILHVRNNTINHFPEIMGRNTGCHTHGNAFGTIDQQIRHLYRKHFRFLFGLIKIRDKIHHIFIQICQIAFLGHLL